MMRRQKMIDLCIGLFLGIIAGAVILMFRGGGR